MENAAKLNGVGTVAHRNGRPRKMDMVCELVNRGVHEIVVVGEIPIVQDNLGSFRVVQAVSFLALLPGERDGKLRHPGFEAQEAFLHLVLIHVAINEVARSGCQSSSSRGVIDRGMVYASANMSVMEKRTALITGASAGIGRELARVMAADGWNLVLVARRESKLRELAEELIGSESGQRGVSVQVVPIDLAQPDAARDLVEVLSREDIEVDALVNSAGLGDLSPFVDSDWEKNRLMIRVNVEALTELTRLLVPSMISRGGGCILNLASVASFQAGPLMAVYYATKAYVLSFSEALAEELRPEGINVTALCPGPTRSGFQETAGVEDVPALNNRLMPSAASVARYGYRAMMRGRRVAIHGLPYRVLIFLSRFLPRGVVVRAVRRFQATRSGA